MTQFYSAVKRWIACIRKVIKGNAGQAKRLPNWQLDPANSNSVISNSSLFRTQNFFPWIRPSVIYYQLCGNLAISNYFSFPLRVRNSGVQRTFSTKVSTCLYSIPPYRDAWRMYDVHKLWTITLDHLVLVSAKHWMMPMWEALKLGTTSVIINDDLWKYLRRKQPILIQVPLGIA